MDICNFVSFCSAEGVKLGIVCVLFETLILYRKAQLSPVRVFL